MEIEGVTGKGLRVEGYMENAKIPNVLKEKQRKDGSQIRSVNNLFKHRSRQTSN